MVERKKKSEDKNIVKIVYFDESSAVDILYISNGGAYNSTAETIQTTANAVSASATAKVEAKAGFLNLFKASGNVGTDGSISREGEKVLRQVFSSTIISDYLTLVKSGKVVTVLNGYRIYPFPESFTYYKLLTPYLAMTEGKLDIGSEMKINVALMDNALEQGRGYYELIAQKDEEKIVLRFNLKAFRNNYLIADLTKMDLEYHVIEVGVTTETALEMKNEFNYQTAELTGFSLLNKDNEENLKVFDVLLAGVVSYD